MIGSIIRWKDGGVLTAVRSLSLMALIVFSLSSLPFQGRAQEVNYRDLCDDKEMLFNDFRSRLIYSDKILKWNGERIVSDNIMNSNLSGYIRKKVEYVKRYSDINISIVNQGVANFFMFSAIDIKGFFQKNKEAMRLFFPDRNIESRLDRIKDEESTYGFVGVNLDNIVSGFVIIENDAANDVAVRAIDRFFNSILGLREARSSGVNAADYGYAWNDLMYLKMIYASDISVEELLAGSNLAYEKARNSRFCR